MDKNIISILEDYKSSIEESFKRIDKAIKSADKKDKNKKRATVSSIKQELANIKSNFGIGHTRWSTHGAVNNCLSESLEYIV